MNGQEETITILDLPTELVIYLCCSKDISVEDINNLALALPNFNNILFDEQNTKMWKIKYFQRYGTIDLNEINIVIDEQNSWKSELSLRLNLEQKIPLEISIMPCKFMRYKNVPFHLYPMNETLHSTNQAHCYYVVSAISKYYKQLQNSKYCNDKFDELYMAHHFLIYSSQVFFGYKLKEFLQLPQLLQTIEKGFYLLGRWWSPTIDTVYQEINNYLNNIAHLVCNLIQSTSPNHPLLQQENYRSQVIKRGKFNLEHDLFDEINTIIIHDGIKQIMFEDSQLVCYCNHDINCFILQKVIERNKGSVFLLCVIYESIARRLGVKVRLTATSVHNFVSWSSSWPDHKVNNPTCYLIDIAGGGAMRKATVCPVSRKLPEHFNGNSVTDLFWTFSKSIEQLTVENMTTYKNVLDFQKLLKPDDAEVEFKCQKFHQYYDFCRCPLIRDLSNPTAPRHIDEKNILYADNEEIFPSVPKKRGTANDPKYAVGMMIDTVALGNTNGTNIVTKCGVIVGWTIVSNTSSLPNPTVYHVLIKSDHYLNAEKYQNPVIKPVWEGRCEKLQRQLNPYDHNFKNIGKFFKYYSHELNAFVPIQALANLYPDDHNYTLNQMNNKK
ncbi:uncharacterized protein LOC126901186 [Daktulosphaira vitifoliae]|uniref:uncharacterized protein LOC126901186 n=1 Tax=Daktulosphaira vitifoliae TaxID=58002 RepID=UPI0021AAD6F2|nr:uncharacterized protein LOC126901186 [Daktulosphaira vitifoliae]